MLDSFQTISLTDSSSALKCGFGRNIGSNANAMVAGSPVVPSRSHSGQHDPERGPDYG